MLSRPAKRKYRQSQGAQGKKAQPTSSLRDWVARDMFVYLTTLPRLLPHPNLLRVFGFKPARTEAMEHRAQDFDRFGFAFITAGSGYVIADGQRWPIQAPCMIFNRAGHNYRAVPDPMWDEMYIVYDREAEPYFKANPWASLSQPVISFNDTDFILPRARQLLDLLPNIRDYGAADRADQIAEALLLEALVRFHGDSPERAKQTAQVQALYSARNWVEKHFQENMDIRQLAARHGLSERHFRRLWQQYFGDSVRQHVQRKRINQATYLLLHSDLRVNEIADILGYSAVSYFIRQFTQSIGCPPVQYRRKEHSSLNQV